MAMCRQGQGCYHYKRMVLECFCGVGYCEGLRVWLVCKDDYPGCDGPGLCFSSLRITFNPSIACGNLIDIKRRLKNYKNGQGMTRRHSEVEPSGRSFVQGGGMMLGSDRRSMLYQLTRARGLKVDEAPGFSSADASFYMPGDPFLHRAF